MFHCVQIVALEDVGTRHQVMYLWDGTDAPHHPMRSAFVSDLVIASPNRVTVFTLGSHIAIAQATHDGS